MAQLLELRGFDKLKQAFEDLEKGIGPASQKIVAGMGAAAKIVEGEIQKRTPVNLGHLRASIQAEVYGKPIDLYGEISTPMIYGPPVEYGRKPGKGPPFEPTNPILLWVKQKDIRFTYKGKELSYEQTAFIIGRKIAKKGIEGAFMFRDGFEAAVPHVEKLWEQVLEDVVRELAK